MAVFEKVRRWFSSRPVEKPAGQVRRLVVSEKLFDPSPGLIAELRRVQTARGADDEITRQHDAFLLDPGLGPATYLSTHGAILWDDDIWDVVPTPERAYAAIVVGANKTGVAALLDLLPKRPRDAVDCARCGGSGWFSAQGTMKDVEGRPFSVVCECGGLGWRVAG